jgi:hypothetical protein
MERNSVRRMIDFGKLAGPLFALVPPYTLFLGLFPPEVARTRPSVIATINREETQAASALTPQKVVIFLPV